jgi:hypothetical protein
MASLSAVLGTGSGCGGKTTDDSVAAGPSDPGRLGCEARCEVGDRECQTETPDCVMKCLQYLAQFNVPECGAAWDRLAGCQVEYSPVYCEPLPGFGVPEECTEHLLEFNCVCDPTCGR